MRYTAMEPIHKGWSGDRKYCITDEKGTKFLLRISDISRTNSKKAQFNRMKQIAALGVPMCIPVESGVCEDGVYSIQSWIDGIDAEEAMEVISGEKRYAYGLEAGRILRSIHSCSCRFGGLGDPL